MTLSDLIRAVGDENVAFENLDDVTTNAQATKGGVRVTFGTHAISVTDFVSHAFRKRWASHLAAARQGRRRQVANRAEGMSGLGLSVRGMRQPISPRVGAFVMLDGPRHKARVRPRVSCGQPRNDLLVRNCARAIFQLNQAAHVLFEVFSHSRLRRNLRESWHE
jgi:hypothetical protein